MEKITSFCVDHDLLKRGVYVSRIDGDITTYDIRTRIPNGGEYMDAVTMQSYVANIMEYNELTEEMREPTTDGTARTTYCRTASATCSTGTSGTATRAKPRTGSCGTPRLVV